MRDALGIPHTISREANIMTRQSGAPEPHKPGMERILSTLHMYINMPLIKLLTNSSTQAKRYTIHKLELKR
jgi:hypothetical protein